MGSVPPVSLGWTRVGNASEGPTDGGWYLHNQIGTWDLQYAWALDPDAVATLDKAGWTITVIASFSGHDESGRRVSSVSLTTSKLFEIAFYRSYNTVPMVVLTTDTGDGSLLHFITTDLNGFHRFDLVYFTEEEAAVLLVDGERALSGYTGSTTAVGPGLLRFGIGPSAAAGHSVFRYVQLKGGQDLEVPAAPTSWGRVKALYRGDGSR
jgi:hypothetical protein